MPLYPPLTKGFGIGGSLYALMVKSRIACTPYLKKKKGARAPFAARHHSTGSARAAMTGDEVAFTGMKV